MKLVAKPITRCDWANSSADYIAYHDTEWGIPIRDDRALYERLVLEGFQSGLSWITVLRKRDNFRKAFDYFEVERVANFSEKKIANLIDAYIKNPDITSDEILEIVPGPDFPLPCKILGTNGIENYISSGRGTVHLEGYYSIESEKNNQQ